jgi:hypothetical protein
MITLTKIAFPLNNTAPHMMVLDEIVLKVNYYLTDIIIFLGPVTKIKNIKTELTKILRPTHFSGPKDIKTDKFFFGLIHIIFFFFNRSSRS